MDKSVLAAGRYQDADRRALCLAVEGLVPGMEERARALDEMGAFPAEDMAALHGCGAMLAVFPERAGGWGLGTSVEGAEALSRVLRLLGRGSLAVGRLFEGHVNAVRLLSRLGTAALVERAAADVAAGETIGLWVTDAGARPLVAEGGRLRGGKAFCSGAGHVGRAVVMVGGGRLAYLPTGGVRVTPLEGRMQGMRAAVTGQVSFEGCSIGEEDWVGVDGDYLEEPDFSAGAWRTSAVTCGGLEVLVEHAMRHLARRGRDGDPHQQARMGQAWIARETASMWLARAMEAAEGRGGEGMGGEVADRVATVNFARIAIERACLDAMTLVERSLGLAAFLHPEPIERVRRDLATYLRQPAADEVLTEAAAHVLRRVTRAGVAAL